jgi:hypothetical protein
MAEDNGESALRAARWIVAIPLFLVGCFLAIVLFHLAGQGGVHGDHLRATGTPVTATVGYGEAGENAQHTVFVGLRLEYTVGSRFYHSAVFRCAAPCAGFGDTVQIWVDPADPTDYVDQYGAVSRDPAEGDLPLGIAAAVAVGLAIGIAAWPYLPVPRRRGMREDLRGLASDRPVPQRRSRQRAARPRRRRAARLPSTDRRWV